MTRIAAVILFISVWATSAFAEASRADTLTDDCVVMTFYVGDTIAADTSICRPAALKEGDVIAIVSPAGEAQNADFGAMAETIERHGFKARVMPHAAGISGSFSASKAERLSDLRKALADTTVKAIICTRGGYGAIQLVAAIDSTLQQTEPKWLVGYSDISVLLALMQHHGIASIHGPMGINLTADAADETPSVEALFEILEGRRPDYKIESHQLNREGKVSGRLVGGNLAVVDGLVGTPFDVMRPGTILFIEDVGEPIYKIQRQLYKLKLSGVLSQLKGLIVGDFTEYKSDANYQTMEQMIRDMVDEYDYPVAFGIPAGHARVNIPLIIGTNVELTVDETATYIRQ